MVLDRLREGVAERPEAGLVRGIMRVLVVLSTQQRVRLTDRDLDFEHVTGGRNGLSRDIVLGQPRLDLLDTLCRRSNHSLNLSRALSVRFLLKCVNK